MRRFLRAATISLTVVGGLALGVPNASATPVCTDGFMGGPPRAACGGRVFPEAAIARDYVQFLPQPGTQFKEFEAGIKYLAQLYPRWVSVFNLRQHYGDDDAVSVGPDLKRSHDPTDTGDGYDIWVVKLTDHQVPDDGKHTMLFSLSVHGDEKGGIEGGLRAVEDLAMGAERNDPARDRIADGVPGYESTTGVDPDFHSYPIRTILRKQAVYFVNFNMDGWARGDQANWPGLYSRGNYLNTDLNRQMPTVGYINPSRNPLFESEMNFGHRFMHEVAEAGKGELMAYGADIHGESQSRAWADIMYPAGQFDSIKHRQLMAIAERTKSVMDDTLFLGLVNLGEEATGGDAGEGIEDHHGSIPKNTVMTKPARWGTVWDTLGYTDTGFIGDYMANELGVTGMDYEIALNHADSYTSIRAAGKPWSVVLQENYINASRAIIKTAMAYAMFQEQEFADFQIDPKGKVGYVFDPVRVRHDDENGAGRLPGPSGNGVGQNGRPVAQRPYSASNMDWFEDTAKYVKGGMAKLTPFEIARDGAALDDVDTLVIADQIAPPDALGRSYDRAAYVANLRAWVERGGNLVLTDRAIHALGEMGVLPAAAITNVNVYQPYSNIRNFGHPMVQGLRKNARQLAEYTLIGYGIGNSASPMTRVTKTAWESAGGVTVGTVGNNAGTSDDQTQVAVGELPLGAGKVRITNGLGKPTEANDHRYGLKDYALTYSGLFILENSIVHDAEGLGGEAATPSQESGSKAPTDGLIPFLGLAPVAAAMRLRRRR
ncbi:MAG TPA: hypothetical protein VM638_08390 [Actinomycetota bacterium]|nr:hypothetical protein [Actinomycetota bacterium]